MNWTPISYDDPRVVAYHTEIIRHAQSVLKTFPNHHQRQMLEDRIAQFRALLPPKDHPVWNSDYKAYFREID